MSKKDKGKGKGKRVPAPGTIEYEGDERCALCVLGEVEVCVVDRAVQEKWASDWNAGVRKKKAPDGSMCQTCAGVHKRCMLPATEEYRPPMYKRKREGDDEVAKGSKVEEELEEPVAKRVKVTTKVGNAMAGPSKVRGSTARVPSATESAAASAESAALSAAASVAALANLSVVGSDIVVSLRLLNYLVARLVKDRADLLPRWLREEVLEAGEDPDAEWVAEQVAKGWDDGEWQEEGEEEELLGIEKRFEGQFDKEEAEGNEGDNEGECFDGDEE